MNKTLIVSITLTLSLLAPITQAQTFGLSKQDVVPAMQKVADWQIANFTYRTTDGLHDYGIGSWTNATLYLGMSRWATIAGSDKYTQWLLNIGDSCHWKVPANFEQHPRYQLYHADELALIQLYAALYQRSPQPQMLDDARRRLDWVLQNPPDTSMRHNNKQSWTWCDALFMAPPAFTAMWQVTGNEQYLAFANGEFKRTYDHLYNRSERLFYRDDSFFERKEANGKDIFWGRGNGWVAAGLANMLKIIPKGHPARPFYESLFKEFVPRLAELQDGTGFWHASLLDPESYPAPETSATAMIAYALAYGVNSGLLPADPYAPIVKKAWNALLTAVGEDGKLGWVQPIGADPKKVTAEMTAVYGIGAFLMAGTEIAENE